VRRDDCDRDVGIGRLAIGEGSVIGCRKGFRTV
jgi:hypothetical protein